MNKMILIEISAFTSYDLKVENGNIGLNHHYSEGASDTVFRVFQKNSENPTFEMISKKANRNS